MHTKDFEKLLYLQCFSYLKIIAKMKLANLYNDLRSFLAYIKSSVLFISM